MDRDDRVLAFVQGRMTELDTRAFEREMAEDRALEVEVDVMRGLRAEFAEEATIDVADGWARFEAALDAEAGAQPANANRAPQFSMLQTGGLIAASLALWQLVAVPMMSPTPPSGYRPVSEQVDVPTLQVMFVAGAEIGEVTALLTANGGAILSGPSAIGLYRVSFETAEARDAALSAFETRSDLIDMVAAE